METRRFRLVVPENLVKDPILFTAAKEYDVVPNIRRANVSATAGELVLELSGEAGNLDQAVAHFEKQGVKVEPVTGDIIEG